MLFSRSAQKFILLLGDAFTFYAALIGTLWVRYLEFPTTNTWEVHNIPFLFVHILWIVLLYIAGLYDIEHFASRAVLRQKIFRTLATAGLLAILLFYFIPSFVITPKTNLIIDVSLVLLLLWGWRTLFMLIMTRSSKINILFFGLSEEIITFAEYLKERPHLGYRPALLIALDNKNEQLPSSSVPIIVLENDLEALIRKHQIQLIVLSGAVRGDKNHIKTLYKMLPLGATVVNFTKFYEDITGKVPVSLTSEQWFLENFSELEKRGFEVLKRGLDIFFALLFGIPALLITPFIALIIIFSTPSDLLLYKIRRSRPGDGLVFFRQKRVGKNGRIFYFVKFRSQRLGAENITEAKEIINDPRQYFFGQLMRKTYLDELPQIWNVLKGEMSFVGPRPERPEFVAELDKKIPFYEMRLVVRPGITGWAQINMKDDASVEDAPEKLQHDLFYIKRRSLSLELSILLRTLAVIMSRSGK
ncbi:MAG: sugar transferase [Parcubacteria group bacterium]|nr:sugar transferase [Parcubacteria group bacterium]